MKGKASGFTAYTVSGAIKIAQQNTTLLIPAIGPPGSDGIGGDDGFPIPGPKGDTGVAGATGPTGPIGPQGAMSFAQDGIDGSDGFPVTPDLSNVALLSAANTFTNTGSQSLSGPLDISAAAAGQIKFPATQNPSSNVNTLDDYEEGTWSPALGATSGSAPTYSAQVGNYVKIGKFVFAWFEVLVNNPGSLSGQVFISGLPFVMQSVADTPGWISYWDSLTSAYVRLAILGASGLARGFMFATAAAATGTGILSGGDIGASTLLIGGINYVASA